jgi:protein SCO1/2
VLGFKSELMRRIARHFRLLPLVAAGCLAIGVAAARGTSAFDKPAGADGQPTNLPPALQGVGVDEHLNVQLPLDAHFVDDQGRNITLGQFFTGKKPVVLQLGYFRCPKLCGLISHGLVDSTKSLGLKAGTDFDMIFLSVQPTETPTLAAQAHDSFVREYVRPDEAGGFHFLVGDLGATAFANGRPRNEAEALADTIGFHYKKQPGTELIAHPAVIFICTPDGHVSRYLYGVDFPAQTLRLSLVEASNGKIGNTIDQILTFCYDYDAKSQSYKLAIGVMRAGGILTMLLLGSGITWLVRHNARAADPVE